MPRKKALFTGFLCILFILACKKKKAFSHDIQECDPIGNYYEDGNHYISRDIVTDDGVINYEEMFYRYNKDDFPNKERKREDFPCDPTINLETR